MGTYLRSLLEPGQEYTVYCRNGVIKCEKSPSDSRCSQFVEETQDAANLCGDFLAVDQSETQQNLELLLQTVAEVESGLGSPSLELGSPWDSSRVVLDILKLARKHNVNKILNYSDKEWSRSLQVEDESGHVRHLPRCREAGWRHCSKCGQVMLVCSNCLLLYRARLPISEIGVVGMSCGARGATNTTGAYLRLNCNEDAHGFTSDVKCVCGRDFAKPVAEMNELMLPQLKSAIGLGQFSLEHGLVNTEQTVRNWITPVLAKLTQSQLSKRCRGCSGWRQQSQVLSQICDEGTKAYMGSLMAEVLYTL